MYVWLVLQTYLVIYMEIYNLYCLDSNHIQNENKIFLRNPEWSYLNSATLIDNIFSNNLHDLHKSTQAILVTDISDHLPIIHINWNFKDRNEELSIIRRSNTKKNREEFRQAMNNINWTELYSMSDTQSAFSYFHNVIKGLHDKHFPKKQINLTHNCRKPWLTTVL